MSQIIDPNTPSASEPVIDRIVKMLNEALTIDPAAITCLLSTRIPCNQGVADNSALIVAPVYAKGLPEENYSIGVLGLINAVVETATGQRVAAVYSDEDDAGNKFPMRLEGFGVFVPAGKSDE
jgi:hypothetical protein